MFKYVIFIIASLNLVVNRRFEVIYEMKIIKNILIIIGAVLLLNYIVYLPMCVDDYIREESDLYICEKANRITLKKTRVCALPLSFFLLIRNHVNKFF